MNAESMLAIFVELLVKSALVALSSLLLLRAWRRATAAHRHLVWFAALTVVVLLPLTHLVAPFWKISLAPAKKATIVVRLPLIELSAPVELDTPVTEPAVATPRAPIL